MDGCVVDGSNLDSGRHEHRLVVQRPLRGSIESAYDSSMRNSLSNPLTLPRYVINAARAAKIDDPSIKQRVVYLSVSACLLLFLYPLRTF